jgi:uncharacterized YccA/Bax inhibitor family protein
MAAITSGSPALKSEYLVEDRAEPRTLSVGGVAVSTLVFLAVLVAGGAWGWASAVEPVGADSAGGYGTTTVTLPPGLWLASLAAFTVSFLVIAVPRRAAALGILYAALEGYVLGAVSAAFEAQTDGIVGAAVLSTVCVFAAALFLYATRLVRPTQRTAFAVTAGILGLCLLYLFVWVLAIFDWDWLYSDEFRSVGIVVNLIAVALAALSFTLDFATIEEGVQRKAPAYLQWYLAFSLTITLVWLYVTLLKLLALLSGDR